jgi:hypothetical protein
MKNLEQIMHHQQGVEDCFDDIVAPCPGDRSQVGRRSQCTEERLEAKRSFNHRSTTSCRRPDISGRDVSITTGNGDG